MNYESLIEKAENEGATIIELDFNTNKKYGRCINNYIFLNSNMTSTEKKEILAEELAHYRKTHGNILNQKDLRNKKQELVARRESYKILLDPVDIVHAMKCGAQNIYELADYLDITIETLNSILNDLRKQYGVGVRLGNYYLQLEPALGLIKDFGELFNY